MKKIISSLMVVLAILSTSHAVEPAHQAAVERLFVAVHMEEQYEISMKGGLDYTAAGSYESIPEEQRAAYKAAMEKVVEMMKAEMGWQKIKTEMVAIYAQKFSLEEINEILPILEKSETRNFMKKQLTVLPEIVQLHAEKAQSLQPQIMQIVQEEMSK